MYKNIVLSLLGVIIMSGCATGFHAGAPKGKINVIAHRGASAYAPENTLASFRLAMEQEADWFELDCTLTKDNKVVVIHDDDLKRTTGVQAKVSTKTLEEIKALDAGAWKDAKYTGEKLPTLAEALSLAHNRTGVYVEVKNSANDMPLIEEVMRMAETRGFDKDETRDEALRMFAESGSRNVKLTRAVIELVRDHKMKNQVVIQSFSPVVCAVALLEAPELRTEFLGGYDKDKPENWPKYLRCGQLIRPKGYNVNQDVVTPEFLADIRGRGATVAVWTVDDSDMMRKLAGWGVNSLITNKPDVCRQVLAEMGMR
jgi:glycerophosphoryl diester phosphodiesterase